MLITNNKVYDVLKEIALIVLPAFATLYLTLAGIWNLPYPQQVSGTLIAVDTFLGAILHISSKQYKETQEEDLK
nr:MAG TPA: holin [Caudoviricetes sp.]